MNVYIEIDGKPSCAAPRKGATLFRAWKAQRISLQENELALACEYKTHGEALLAVAILEKAGVPGPFKVVEGNCPVYKD